jgi:uncharacterized membrane protein YoaK (UPF0700 family)
MATSTSLAGAPPKVAVRLRGSTLAAATLVGAGGGGYWLATARNPTLMMLGFIVACAAVGLSAQMWISRDPLRRDTHLVSPLPAVGVFAVSRFWPHTELDLQVALLLAVAAGMFMSISLEFARRYRDQLRGRR